MRSLLGLSLLALLTACSDNDSTALPVGLPIRVTPADIGEEWIENDTRDGGLVMIDEDTTPPLFGSGCLAMSTTDTAGGSSQAKGQLFFYGYGSLDQPGAGVLLSEITSLGYWAYRDSSSTNPIAQTISLNIEVDFVGDGSSYTTLVFEPVYNTQPMLQDTWQYWDAFQDGAAIWWSTRDIPGATGGAFVSLQTILDNNPNARIRYGVGFNVGSGWTGDFFGFADGLEVGVNGERDVYDFEPR